MTPPADRPDDAGARPRIRRGQAPPDLVKMLDHLLGTGASDLHLKVGSAPHVRIDGRLEAAPFDMLKAPDTERIARAIIPSVRVKEFEEKSDTDFALGVAGKGRFRVNVHRQRGSIGIVLRRVPPGTPTFEQLGLPATVRKIADLERGLVLVAGPTGSGKTTTVSAMIQHINSTRPVSIITIENPIEVLFRDDKAIVSQREIGTDTASYVEAMRRTLRQDPDVVFLGEITDAETAQAAFTAAETGQLVISTLPALTSLEAVNRVVDFFPPEQHRQVRLSLASVLQGIVAQRLLERADGEGQVACVEVMTMTPKIFDFVVDPSSQRLPLDQIIAEGEYYGMRAFDQSLLELLKRGLVDYRAAAAVAVDPGEFRIAVESGAGRIMS